MNPETLRQYTLDKQEHNRSCVDGYIQKIHKFTGQLVEVRCNYCQTLEKAKAKRDAMKQASLTMSSD